MADKEKKLKCIHDICNLDVPYGAKLEAYEYLSENGEEVIEEMIAKLYETEGDCGQMLMEILANFKGRKEIYLWLVTFFYRGDDTALFAKLLGSYGDERAIDVLNSFAKENQLDYNEFMEVRNAVEMLGGTFTSAQDFSDDEFYKFIKGLDDDNSASTAQTDEDYKVEEEAEEYCECGCNDETEEISKCSCEHGDEECDCDESCDCGCQGNDEHGDDCKCGCHDEK